MLRLSLRPSPSLSYFPSTHSAPDALQTTKLLCSSPSLTAGPPRKKAKARPQNQSARPRCPLRPLLCKLVPICETYALHNITSHLSPYNISAYEPLHIFHLGVSKRIKLAAFERLWQNPSLPLPVISFCWVFMWTWFLFYVPTTKF